MAWAASCSAAEPILVLEIAGQKAAFSRGELLARAQTIIVPADIAYGRENSFKAVPLSGLLAGFDLPADSVLEAVASDGFVAQIPLDAIMAGGPGKAEAWLAVEPPDAPWPKLPGKQVSAGPFYLVWLRPGAAHIGPEQWPYQIAVLRSADAPAKRWPQIAAASTLPADHPARRGQEIFIKNCIACHKLNGGGGSAVGPDLNLPMNPTEYFKDAALRAYIRDPQSVRAWPEQKMPGFKADALSDTELDALIAYLAHMAENKARR